MIKILSLEMNRQPPLKNIVSQNDIQKTAQSCNIVHQVEENMFV